MIDVSIVTSGHDVADARLHRLTAALHARGLAVEVLGLGRAEDGPAGARVRTWRRLTPVRRALHALLLPWRASGRTLLAIDPDSTFAAWARARLTGRTVVADVHEDYRAVLHDRAWARGVRRLLGAAWARLGLLACRHADLLVVADEHLLPGYPRRIVVRNMPDLSSLPEPTEPGTTPRVIYIGDVRRSRGLYRMLDALRAAPEWHLDVIGPVAEADLRARDLDPGLSDRVHFHDRLPPQRAWTFAAGAWAGLALLDDTPAFRASLPTKVYEYLACGLPVLTSPLPRPAELVSLTGAGAVAADEAEAAAVLVTWVSQPAVYRAARDGALRWRQGLDSHVYARFAAEVDALARPTRDDIR